MQIVTEGDMQIVTEGEGFWKIMTSPKIRKCLDDF